MSRSELAVTIAGLLATFFLPWPAGEEAIERPRSASARAIEPAQAGVLIGPAQAGSGAPYGDFGRVRTGPTEGIHPTR